jgi:hypothetical protein
VEGLKHLAEVLFPSVLDHQFGGVGVDRVDRVYRFRPSLKEGDRQLIGEVPVECWRQVPEQGVAAPVVAMMALQPEPEEQQGEVRAAPGSQGLSQPLIPEPRDAAGGLPVLPLVLAAPQRERGLGRFCGPGVEAQEGQEQWLEVLERQRSVVLAAVMSPWVRGLEESLQRVQAQEDFMADPFEEWVSWTDSVGWVGYRVPRAEILPVEEEGRANAREAAWDAVYEAAQERARALERVPCFRGRELLSERALLGLRDDGGSAFGVLEGRKGWEFHCVTQRPWEEMALWQRVLWADQRWAWEQLATAESELSQLWALLDQRELWSMPGGPLMPGMVLEGRWEAGRDTPGYILGD